mgnify:CR=1 FL=1
MDIYEVVKKLLGPIEPIGDSGIDEKRFANLIETEKLVNQLLFDINQVASYRDCQEYSRKVAGERAEQFLKDIKES